MIPWVLSVAVLLSPAEEQTAKALVPFWVPREVQTGLFVNSPMVALHVRLNWGLTFYERGGHNLFAALQVGTALALTVPVGMKEHFQHVALLGIAYRKTTQTLNWGFQWTLGPNWYRASFDPELSWRLESYVVPYSEGRINVGYRVLKHLVLGIYGGYAAPVEFDERYPGRTYVGGVLFGLYADWR